MDTATQGNRSHRSTQGRDTILELYIQGSKTSHTDEHAVAFIQEIADKPRIQVSVLSSIPTQDFM